MSRTIWKHLYIIPVNRRGRVKLYPWRLPRIGKKSTFKNQIAHIGETFVIPENAEINPNSDPDTLRNSGLLRGKTAKVLNITEDNAREDVYHVEVEIMD